MIVGVIPARGGSKGVLRKNIKLLAGKPLIWYTIKAAMDSKKLDDFYVSSDDDEILKVAKNLGAKTIKRPAELAGDKVAMVPVLKHAIESIGKVDYLVLLQPTTPFKTGKDIDDAVKLLIDSGADSVITLVRMHDAHPARMYKLQGDKMVSLMDGKDKFTPRQDLPPVYLRNGAVYAYKKDTIMVQEAQEGKDSRGLVMPAERSLNIDEPMDFEMAELMMEK
jgi:CMP-N,N'-diacetyllegionaminic acid synthase